MKQLSISITLLAVAILFAALTSQSREDVVTAQIVDGTPDRPEERAPKREDDETSIPLNTDDPTFNIWKRVRDFSKDKREPGLINVQRQDGGFPWIGIPTFFKLPVALTPADLKAGKVEVAILGADFVNGPRAATFGPQELRNPRNDLVPTWGKWSMPNIHTMVNPFEEMVICDYGDCPLDSLSMHRSTPVLRGMVREIASNEYESGKRTIPIIIGGCHAMAYPDIMGIVDAYGKGNVGVIHFDAHSDTSAAYAGHLVTHGNPVYRLVMEGFVPGKNYIEVGLRGYAPDAEDFQWMREHRMRYHTMAEIERRGWDPVMEDVIKEANDGPKYIFISFDIDVIDPVYMPGTHTPESGGITIHDAMKIVRRLCAESNVVGFELVELRPERDPGYITMLNCNRLIREALTGLAMRKKGLTGKHYLSPLTVDDGQE